MAGPEPATYKLEIRNCQGNAFFAEGYRCFPAKNGGTADRQINNPAPISEFQVTIIFESFFISNFKIRIDTTIPK